MKNQGPWVTPRSFHELDAYLSGKSGSMRKFAKEHGMVIHEFKLVDGGPEFEVVQPPAPTYEQAIVSMFREAKGILEVGAKLKDDMFVARHDYLHYSTALRLRREMDIKPSSSSAKAYLVKQGERRVLQALDELWLAQEKYKAWAATYGDI